MILENKLDYRNVSKKAISNSYRGILRISPDEGEEDKGITEELATITDSIGTPAPMKISSNAIEISNAKLEGNIKIGENDPNSTCEIENLNVKNLKVNGVKYPNSPNPNDLDIIIAENNNFTLKNLDTLLKEYFKKFVSNVPVGSVISTMDKGDDYIHTGTSQLAYLLLNGQEVPKSLYIDLYNTLVGSDAISSTTESTFKLPDLRGYFLRGLDTENTVDTESGRYIGKVQGPGVPNIRFEIAGGYLGSGTMNHCGAVKLVGGQTSQFYVGSGTVVTGYNLSFNAKNGVYKDLPTDINEPGKLLEWTKSKGENGNKKPGNIAGRIPVWYDTVVNNIHNYEIYKDNINDVRVANVAVNYIIKT